MTDEAASREPVGQFPTLRRTSVALQTVEAIKDMIRVGDLVPGQMLPGERELAQALEISRPTLRQAIGALTTLNILESRHGEGTFVTSLTLDVLAQPIEFILQIEQAAVGQLFEVRLVLEVEAARLAADRVDDEAIAGLQAIGSRAAGLLDDPDSFAQTDFDLHAAIVRATENPLYASLCNTVAALTMDRRRRSSRMSKQIREATLQDHDKIVAAIAKRDTDAAGSAMAAHLERVRDILAELDGA